MVSFSLTTIIFLKFFRYETIETHALTFCQILFYISWCDYFLILLLCSIFKRYFGKGKGRPLIQRSVSKHIRLFLLSTIISSLLSFCNTFSLFLLSIAHFISHCWLWVRFHASELVLCLAAAMFSKLFFLDKHTISGMFTVTIKNNKIDPTIGKKQKYKILLLYPKF